MNAPLIQVTIDSWGSYLTTIVVVVVARWAATAVEKAWGWCLKRLVSKWRAAR